jgi:hypothetical protein
MTMKELRFRRKQHAAFSCKHIQVLFWYYTITLEKGLLRFSFADHRGLINVPRVAREADSKF